VVNANGIVLVLAQDDTDVDVMAGAAALGRSLIGAGDSLTTVAIVKDTQAFIGQRATVNARGNSPGTLTVLDGSVKPALGTETIHGLGVQARSSEEVFSVAGAGTASSLIGLS